MHFDCEYEDPTPHEQTGPTTTKLKHQLERSAASVTEYETA
jgi:hypothetical protein